MGKVPFQSGSLGKEALTWPAPWTRADRGRSRREPPDSGRAVAVDPPPSKPYLNGQLAKKAQDMPRREARLPKANVPLSRRVASDRFTAASSTVTPRGTRRQSSIATNVDLRVVHGIRAGA